MAKPHKSFDNIQGSNIPMILALGDPTLLLREYKIVLGVGAKVTGENAQTLLMLEFDGLVNNSGGKQAKFAVAMSPEDGWNFLECLMERYEDVLNLRKSNIKKKNK